MKVIYPAPLQQLTIKTKSDIVSYVLTISLICSLPICFISMHVLCLFHYFFLQSWSLDCNYKIAYNSLH